MSADRERLRMSFDADPERYDRTRPVCPDQVFDDLVALTGWRPGACLVEIGCGTGQATLPLAERGFSIVGVELGPRLAAFARQKLAAFPKVEIVQSSFEDWRGQEASFDGVVAVNSFHWLDPAMRYAKSARLLRDDGALVVISSPVVQPDDADPFWSAVQQDYDAVRGGPAGGAPLHPDAVGDLREEIVSSGFFPRVDVRRYLWHVRYTAEDYVAWLSTSSWHQQLEEGELHSLLGRIQRRIEALPEPSITVSLLAILHVARRCLPS